MKAMCAFLGLSRASYYAWAKRMTKPDRDRERMQLVKEAWERSRRTYGYRRIAIWIAQHRNQVINRKAVLRLMRKLKIRSIARKRNPNKPYHQMRQQHTYANLLKQDFKAERPNQKWVTDVTFIATDQGWAYLATIRPSL